MGHTVGCEPHRDAWSAPLSHKAALPGCTVGKPRLSTLVRRGGAHTFCPSRHRHAPPRFQHHPVPQMNPVSNPFPAPLNPRISPATQNSIQFLLVGSPGCLLASQQPLPEHVPVPNRHLSKRPQFVPIRSLFDIVNHHLVSFRPP